MHGGTEIQAIEADGASGEVLPREQQVRNAALRLFRDKGYHATSMRDIAEAVGINKGSLYSYIRSKEDLLIPFFEQAMGLLVTEIEAITADASLTPTERLRQAVKAPELLDQAGMKALNLDGTNLIACVVSNYCVEKVVGRQNLGLIILRRSETNGTSFTVFKGTKRFLQFHYPEAQ